MAAPMPWEAPVTMTVLMLAILALRCFARSCATPPRTVPLGRFDRGPRTGGSRYAGAYHAESWSPPAPALWPAALALSSAAFAETWVVRHRSRGLLGGEDVNAVCGSYPNRVAGISRRVGDRPRRQSQRRRRLAHLDEIAIERDRAVAGRADDDDHPDFGRQDVEGVRPAMREENVV